MAISQRERYANAYSQDLRQRGLDLIVKGVSISNVSQLLGVSRTTLYKWLQHLEKTGSNQPKNRKINRHQAKIIDWDKFKKFVELHGEKTQEEMAVLWGNCTRHTISRGLKKIGYTRKKKPIVIKNAVK